MSFTRCPMNGLLMFGASILLTRHTKALFTPLRVLRSLLSTTAIAFPIAKKVPEKISFGVHPTEIRGDGAMSPAVYRDDHYNWLRDMTRTKTDVLDHLKAENAYADEALLPLKPFQDVLYKEMLSHLKETDEEVPYKDGPFFYYSRTVEGLSYRIHCRKDSIDASAAETEVLDENRLAKGHEYSDVQTIEWSPSHSLVAYAVDHSGYETYSVAVERIGSPETVIDEIKNTSGDLVWGADDSSFFYLGMDEEHRPNKLFLHVLGTPQEQDVCVHTEDDQLYWMHMSKTADDKYLLFGADSKETSEVFAIDLQNLSGGAAHIAAVTITPTTTPERVKCLQPKEQGLRYEVEHREGIFYVTTNADGAKNMKLMQCSASVYFNANANTNANTNASANANKSSWRDVREYKPTEQIDNVMPFANWVAIFGREEGVQRLWLMVPGEAAADWSVVEFTTEPAYSIWPSANADFNSTSLRLGFSSFKTPKQIIDLHVLIEAGNGGGGGVGSGVVTRVEVKKEQEVPLYDRSLYTSKRIEALSSDGITKIPISLVYKKLKSDGDSGLPQNRPCLLYGYGSYGACMDPTFDYKRSAMLDRGVVYAIGHIRGGGEMGRSWYEDEGKYLTKKNTFEDFADCARHLQSSGVTSAEQIAIVGRSAGGLLVGATVNMYPELFKCVVADVPFVDVLNTMCDPTIPLTVTEWEEWGNPNVRDYFDYMASYSPYDNVIAQKYPSMFITGGLNDPRVPFWEPAKWAAKLRDLKTDTNPLIFKTDMGSGHFSASDRYKFIRETAVEYSFVLDQIGAKEIVE